MTTPRFSSRQSAREHKEQEHNVTKIQALQRGNADRAHTKKKMEAVRKIQTLHSRRAMAEQKRLDTKKKNKNKYYSLLNLQKYIKKRCTLLPTQFWNKRNYNIDPDTIVALGIFSYKARNRPLSIITHDYLGTVYKLFCVSYNVKTDNFDIYCKSIPMSRCASMVPMYAFMNRIYKTIFNNEIVIKKRQNPNRRSFSIVRRKGGKRSTQSNRNCRRRRQCSRMNQRQAYSRKRYSQNNYIRELFDSVGVGKTVHKVSIKRINHQKRGGATPDPADTDAEAEEKKAIDSSDMDLYLSSGEVMSIIPLINIIYIVHRILMGSKYCTDDDKKNKYMNLKQQLIAHSGDRIDIIQNYRQILEKWHYKNNFSINKDKFNKERDETFKTKSDEFKKCFKESTTQSSGNTTLKSIDLFANLDSVSRFLQSQEATIQHHSKKQDPHNPAPCNAVYVRHIRYIYDKCEDPIFKQYRNLCQTIQDTENTFRNKPMTGTVTYSSNNLLSVVPPEPAPAPAPAPEPEPEPAPAPAPAPEPEPEPAPAPTPALTAANADGNNGNQNTNVNKQSLPTLPTPLLNDLKNNNAQSSPPSPAPAPAPTPEPEQPPTAPEPNFLSDIRSGNIKLNKTDTESNKTKTDKSALTKSNKTKTEKSQNSLLVAMKKGDSPISQRYFNDALRKHRTGIEGKDENNEEDDTGTSTKPVTPQQSVDKGWSWSKNIINKNPGAPAVQPRSAVI